MSRELPTNSSEWSQDDWQYAFDRNELPDGMTQEEAQAKLSGSDDEESDGSYGSMKKDDLVAAAEERGVDSSGTKADIIERLEADDAEGEG
jgi:hypothetical protein